MLLKEGKILIMGTGGCGSGFIWHMLKNCGLETTEHREWIRSGGIIHAEDPTTFPAPKVIKHLGGFLNDLNPHIKRYQWGVEHIFFAIATLDLAMDIQKSRLEKRNKTFNYDIELERYYSKLGRGLAQLAETEYPFTIVRCPTSILDVSYCYNKLKVVLPNITYEGFAEKHEAWVKHERKNILLAYES